MFFYKFSDFSSSFDADFFRSKAVVYLGKEY